MNVTEVLQFADELVFQQTGKHLDDSQQAVVKGVWEGRTYEKIADECNRSERHVRDVGYKLWQILSEKLGEDIHKSNFHSTFERLKTSPQSSQNTTQQVVNIGINSSINLYPDGSKLDHHISLNTEDSLIIKSHYQDLTLAPKIINFYARESELKTLSNWILNRNTRLISILGLSGVGKTTLVKRFVDLNLPQFEVIIWKSLKHPKSLDLLINDFLTVCQQTPKETIDDKLKQLVDILKDKKCLIILDDVQNIFASGQFAGQYKSEYQDYQNFFTMITETEHQSNVILISQEQCAEMECLDEELYPIRCLELSGLDDISILNNIGLEDEDSWLNLINLYEGNLTYLKSVSMLINKNYDGKVADFLTENNFTTDNIPVPQPAITTKMQSHFREIFNKLSPIEKEIILQLSKSESPISREELRQNLNLSSVDFNNGLQSLQQRYLVTKIKAEKILFKLSPVFKEYVKNCYKD